MTARPQNEDSYPCGQRIALASSPEAGPRYSPVACRACHGAKGLPKFNVLREFMPGRWTWDYLCAECVQRVLPGELDLAQMEDSR